MVAKMVVYVLEMSIGSRYPKEQLRAVMTTSALAAAVKMMILLYFIAIIAARIKVF
jgi:hypothetical protein